MFFLIEYDRQKENLLRCKVFKDSDREKAENERLKIELDLNRKNINHEVVILEASSQNMVRHTHQRYFKTLKEMSK